MDNLDDTGATLFIALGVAAFTVSGWFVIVMFLMSLLLHLAKINDRG